MRQTIAALPIFILTACDAVTPTQPQGPALPATTEDTCNAASFANLIGQDATALERVLLIGEVRVIRPGDAVTMDFRPERINFQIGSDNRIASISCS